jgi:hypothetical protein
MKPTAPIRELIDLVTRLRRAEIAFHARAQIGDYESVKKLEVQVDAKLVEIRRANEPAHCRWLPILDRLASKRDNDSSFNVLTYDRSIVALLTDYLDAVVQLLATVQALTPEGSEALSLCGLPAAWKPVYWFPGLPPVPESGETVKLMETLRGE